MNLTRKKHKKDLREKTRQAQLTEDELLDFWVLFGRIRDQMFKARHRELSQFGITNEQAGVLQILRELGGSAGSAELSRFLFRQRQSAHQILERMERTGLVIRQDNPDRKKGVKFALSPTGIEAQNRLAARKFLRTVLSHFSENEYADLMASLQKLMAVVKKELREEHDVSLRPAHLRATGTRSDTGYLGKTRTQKRK